MNKIKSVLKILSYWKMGLDVNSKLSLFVISLIQLSAAPLFYFSKETHYRYINYLLTSFSPVIYINYGGHKFKLGNGRDFFIINSEDELKEIISAGGNVFIDVGAHIGSYTVSFADKYDKVVAVEPTKANRTLLQENLRLNGLAKKVILISEAVGSMVHENARIYIGKNNSGAHSLLANEETEKNKFEYVTLTTLDEIIESNGIAPSDITMVKIDVEGYEIEVLKGMTRILKEGNPRIVLEIWDHNVKNQKEAQKIAKSMGYKINIVCTNNWIIER